MRLWPRRKVIYTWDDNFAPRYFRDPGPYIDTTFQWHCPDTGYLRLTGISVTFIAALGIRGATFVTFSLYHANWLRMELRILWNPISHGDHHLSLNPGTIPSGYANRYIRPLPIPTRMIPGDWFQFVTATPLPGDGYKDALISADYYEFY